MQPETIPIREADGHTTDFLFVLWKGVRYQLSPKQAAVVRQLWEAHGRGLPDVHQEQLLRGADSDGVRLVDLFKRHPAWQNLIISVKQGYYRLAGELSLTARADAGDCPQAGPDPLGRLLALLGGLPELSLDLTLGGRRVELRVTGVAEAPRAWDGKAVADAA